MNAHNEQHDPALAVVKQNLTTQPAAAQEAVAWAVYGQSDEWPEPVLLADYVGSMEVIRKRVMEGAIRDGFKGDFVERMAELGWWLEPLVLAAPVTAAPAKCPACASATESYCCNCGWASVSTPAAPGIDHHDLVSSLQSMRDRMMAVLVPKFGEAFDGDFDTMLEAINVLKRIDARPKSSSLSVAVPRAYGYLWHVNHPEDIPAGHPFMSPDRAAVEARKELRDMLTNQQRGEGINWVRQKLLAEGLDSPKGGSEACERIAAMLYEEATDEPWTVAGVEHEIPDRAYYRELARRVLDAAQAGDTEVQP